MKTIVIISRWNIFDRRWNYRAKNEDPEFSVCGTSNIDVVRLFCIELQKRLIPISDYDFKVEEGTE